MFTSLNVTHNPEILVFLNSCIKCPRKAAYNLRYVCLTTPQNFKLFSNNINLPPLEKYFLCLRHHCDTDRQAKALNLEKKRNNAPYT